MTTKTPDEIKEQLLKECRYQSGTLGNWFEECMDKAFSLGVEEGAKFIKDNLNYKAGFNKACEDMIKMLDGNYYSTINKIIIDIRKLQEGQP